MHKINYDVITVKIGRKISTLEQIIRVSPRKNDSAVNESPIKKDMSQKDVKKPQISRSLNSCGSLDHLVPEIDQDKIRKCRKEPERVPFDLKLGTVMKRIANQETPRKRIPFWGEL